jgi:hypothetical protein
VRDHDGAMHTFQVMSVQPADSSRSRSTRPKK